MTLQQIIGLFEEIEAGKQDQLIGYHLHKAITQANNQHWRTNDSYNPTFSGFLKALSDEENPPERCEPEEPIET